jgi:hypothetical protein
MRTTLFRTAPVLIDGADVVVFTKDMDGVDPFDLFLENMDVAASLRTRHGSKNANLRFVAASAGAGGNSITVTITAGAGQAYSAAVVGDDVTINLLCDASGKPVQLASEIMDLLNASTVAAKIRTVLALGSDGSATMEIPDPTAPTVVMAQTSLAGGFTAEDLDAVSVEYSPQGVADRPLQNGAVDFPGPWITLDSVTFAGLAAGSSAALTVDRPIRGLRMKASKAAYDTVVVATAVAKKKPGV